MPGLARRIDASRIGAVGHSLGGKAAVYLAIADERIRACVNLDGWPLHPRAERVGLRVPFLMMEEVREVSDAELASWKITRAKYENNISCAFSVALVLLCLGVVYVCQLVSACQCVHACARFYFDF